MSTANIHNSLMDFLNGNQSGGNNDRKNCMCGIHNGQFVGFTLVLFKETGKE